MPENIFQSENYFFENIFKYIKNVTTRIPVENIWSSMKKCCSCKKKYYYVFNADSGTFQTNFMDDILWRSHSKGTGMYVKITFLNDYHSSMPPSKMENFFYESSK